MTGLNLFRATGRIGLAFVNAVEGARCVVAEVLTTTAASDSPSLSPGTGCTTQDIATAATAGLTHKPLRPGRNKYELS